MMVFQKLWKSGHSLCVAIPQEYARHFQWEPKAPVALELCEDRVIVANPTTLMREASAGPAPASKAERRAAELEQLNEKMLRTLARLRSKLSKGKRPARSKRPKVQRHAKVDRRERKRRPRGVRHAARPGR